MLPRNHDPGPLWSAQYLLFLCLTFDAIAWPALKTLALISAVISSIGLLSQFTNPDITDFLLCLLMGVSLWMIARIFWTGAWSLPHIEAKNPLLIFALVAGLGFSSYSAVSVTANLSATAGEVSLDLTQQGGIDKTSNDAKRLVSYVGKLNIIRAALADRAEQARILEDAEIAGNGPTGEPGVGTVSNSYAAAAGKFDQAASLLDTIVQNATPHVSGLNTVLVELRAAQINADMTTAEKRTHLKNLEAQAIGEMQALLSLDPARVIRQAAQSITEGVPARSQAKRQSQARIAEINAGMRLYATQLEAEADRIATLAPPLPEQVTLSTAERLFAVAARLPALTMAALLLDLCGWIGVGFRQVLYQVHKIQSRKEDEQHVPNYVTLTEIARVEEFARRMAEAKHRIETETGAPKRGRPRQNKPTAELTQSPQRKRNAKNSEKGQSDA